jgi:hypothetical protein
MTYTQFIFKNIFKKGYTLLQQIWNYQHKTLQTILFDKRTHSVPRHSLAEDRFEEKITLKKHLDKHKANENKLPHILKFSLIYQIKFSICSLS